MSLTKPIALYRFSSSSPLLYFSPPTSPLHLLHLLLSFNLPLVFSAFLPLLLSSSTSSSPLPLFLSSSSQSVLSLPQPVRPLQPSAQPVQYSSVSYPPQLLSVSPNQQYTVVLDFHLFTLPSFTSSFNLNIWVLSHLPSYGLF